jgi:3-hydroxybutyryl-CoA dehydrogenase
MRIIKVIRAMQIVVLTDEALKEELLKNGTETSFECIYVNSLDEMLLHTGADGYIDLLFEFNNERINKLKSLLPKPVIVNSVIHILNELPANFIRINGWPTFLASDLVEGAASESQKSKGEEILMLFHKKISWLPGDPEFFLCRLVTVSITTYTNRNTFPFRMHQESS